MNFKKLIIITSFLFFLSCASKLPKIYEGTIKKEEKRIEKVAILPFKNQSQYPMGGVILYKIFMAELIRFRRCQVELESEVRKIFIQQRVYPTSTLSKDFYIVLADRLSIDAIITGDILKMREGENPELSFWIKVIDPKTGNFLWCTFHKRDGEYYRKLLHFGKIRTISALAKKMCEEIIKKWEKEHLL